jgi:hypothetical protein
MKEGSNIDKVEIIEKRVEGNNIIFTAYYYPDEKDANTKIRFEQRQASDFLMTTDGRKDTMAKLLDSGRNRWNVNQIATDKSGALFADTFNPTYTIKTPVETNNTRTNIPRGSSKGSTAKKVSGLGIDK